MLSESIQAPRDIAEAYAEGVLFAHMFEFLPGKAMPAGGGDPIYTDRYLPAFFRALTGTGGFEGNWRTVVEDKRGYVGLATTAMKKGQATRLWTDCSSIGLLFDGRDQDHFQPFFFNSEDAYSKIETGVPQYMEITGNEKIKILRDIQERPRKGHFMLDLVQDVSERVVKSMEALKKFWEVLETGKWQNYFRDLEEDYYRPYNGVNEMNAIAHARSVRGIIIDEGKHRDVQNGKPIQSSYSVAVQEAKQLRGWLSATYPEIFPELLPIFSYDRHRSTDRLHQLAPLDLMRPHLSDSVAIGSAITRR